MDQFLNSRNSVASIRTGPSRPKSCSGESFFQSRQLVRWRPAGLGFPSSIHFGRLQRAVCVRSLSSASCSSPIMRFDQRLTALTSSVFSPGLQASVTSTRNGTSRECRDLGVEFHFGDHSDFAEIETAAGRARPDPQAH